MMNHKHLTLATLAACIVSTAQAFAPATTSNSHCQTQLNALSFDTEPDVLSNCNLPGNFGFDPLRLAQTPNQLVTYRKAEMKHGRLAMLAALAILVSDFHVVDTLGATPLVEGRAFPQFWGALVGLPAAIELYGDKVEQNHENDATYFPGQLDLDPFRFYPASTTQQRRVQFAEIMTGRVCMLAVAGRWMEDALEGMGILGGGESLLSWWMPGSSTAVVMEAMEDVIV